MSNPTEVKVGVELGLWQFSVVGSVCISKVCEYRVASPQIVDRQLELSWAWHSSAPACCNINLPEQQFFWTPKFKFCLKLNFLNPILFLHKIFLIQNFLDPQDCFYQNICFNVKIFGTTFFLTHMFLTRPLNFSPKILPTVLFLPLINGFGKYLKFE